MRRSVSLRLQMFLPLAALALALVGGPAPAFAQDAQEAVEDTDAAYDMPPVHEEAPQRADEGHQHEPVSGLRMGGGLRIGSYLNADPDRARGSVNPQQFGFDGFLGFSFPSGLYIGGGFRPFLGQKSATGGRFMAQEFTLDVGYVFQVDAKLGIRPTFELGFLRYGTRVGGVKSSDFGPMAAGGLDFIADVLPHFFLGAGGRMGFALLGKDADDITVSDGPIDIYMQFGAFAGLRF